MTKKKSVSLLILGLILTIACVVGVSYAIWQITLQQESTNVITTGCFQITFEETEGSNIHLDNAYPISDEEGKGLTPYKFKIKNNCDSYAKYNIALEVTNDSTLSSEYMKAMFQTSNPKILNTYKLGTSTLENTKEAFILETDYLYYQEEKEYELRLWMDENTPAIDETMNQIWQGKITVTASYSEDAPITSGTIRVVYGVNDGMWKYRNTTSKIVIQNELKPIEGAIQEFDESALQDGSVMSYIVQNEDGTTYTAYLQSNRKLILNPYSSYLFYKFTKVTEIEGMEYLDTSNVTNMMEMFSYMSSLTSLDLSNFDTSKVTSMSNIFYGDNNLTNIIYGNNFIKNDVAIINGMFEYCPANKPIHTSWDGSF